MKNKLFFAKNKVVTKEQIIKQKEREILSLYDESILLKCKGQLEAAKDKCRQANRKLQAFKQNNVEYSNVELDFGIKLNLALICQGLNHIEEAVHIYKDILQLEGIEGTKSIQHYRVRINLGNINFQQNNFKAAIVEYKKALNHITKENAELRANVLRNMAAAYIKLTDFDNSIESYEESFHNLSEVRTAMNLILCYLATKNINKAKDVFDTMLKVANREVDTEFENPDEPKKNIDLLKEFFLNKNRDNSNVIVNISLLITRYIDQDPNKAFDYIIDCLKKVDMRVIINEIEMAKAMFFLKQRNITQTINIMKSFENKDKNLIAKVANNISFIYYVEGQLENAEKYSKIALENEKYNNKALINMGNVYFSKGDYVSAKDNYLESIGVNSNCVEAIYNLGMVNIKMELYYDAIDAFEKLNRICPFIPEVLVKLAKLYEFVKDYDQAIKNYNNLLKIIPNEPNILTSLGILHYRINESDEKTYMHYFNESFKAFPGNKETLAIIGFLHFKEDMFEKALIYFDLACKVEPQNEKVAHQFALCLYKMGSYREAYKAFKRVHNKFPDHIPSILVTSSQLPYCLQSRSRFADGRVR